MSACTVSALRNCNAILHTQRTHTHTQIPSRSSTFPEQISVCLISLPSYLLAPRSLSPSLLLFHHLVFHSIITAPVPLQLQPPRWNKRFSMSHIRAAALTEEQKSSQKWLPASCVKSFISGYNGCDLAQSRAWPNVPALLTIPRSSAHFRCSVYSSAHTGHGRTLMLGSGDPGTRVPVTRHEASALEHQVRGSSHAHFYSRGWCWWGRRGNWRNDLEESVAAQACACACVWTFLSASCLAYCSSSGSPWFWRNALWQRSDRAGSFGRKLLAHTCDVTGSGNSLGSVGLAILRRQRELLLVQQDSSATPVNHLKARV